MSEPRLRAGSVGYHFADPRVLNVSFGSPQTLLDRDVVLFSPSGFYQDYRPQPFHAYFEGAWNVGDDDSARLVRDMARRRREFGQLLDLGKTLVLFVPPPERFFVGTGRDEWSGTGRNRQRIRGVAAHSVLSTLPFRLHTEEGASAELELRGGEPFATFWRANRERMAASAVITNPPGSPALTIKGTDAVVASIASEDKGLVVLLPQHLLYGSDDEDLHEDFDDEDADESGPATDPEDVEFLDSLFELVAALRRDRGDFEVPDWAHVYRLPNESDLVKKLDEAEDELARALARVDEGKRALERLRQRKVLFTGSGPALEALVDEALQAFGFDVVEGPVGRTDRIAKRDDAVAVVEVKGLAKSAAEKNAAQLEKWATEYHIEHGAQPKGILVVNGWRAKALAERSEAVFPDQMVGFSKGRGHALVTGLQLLLAWLDVEAHAEKTDVVAQSLLDAVGVWDRYEDWSNVLTVESVQVSDDI